MIRPNEEEAITYMGWWSEDEKKDSPEPWETFTLMVHGREAGDSRNATVEDLRPAGFVPATEPRFTLEEIEQAVAMFINSMNTVWSRSGTLVRITPSIATDYVMRRLAESRR